jgi:tetratricopeptide (TPR) repeat protein
MIRKSHLLALATASALALGALAVTTPALAVGGGVGAAPPNATKSINLAKRYEDGIKALQNKQYKEAERCFDDVLDSLGKNPGANYMMGQAKIGLESWKDARKYMAAAVRYDANMIEARGWLGTLDAKLGDKAKAAESRAALEAAKTACAGTCEKAQLIDAFLAQIDGMLADPTMKLSNVADMKRFASAETGTKAYLSAYGLINEGKYETALGLLSDASLLGGPSADVLTYQGFANRKLGHLEDALRFYSAALTLEPEHRGANEYLGEYYVEIGDMGRARAQLRKLDVICKFGCAEAEELRRWVSRGKT